jgi:hypothetical protein
MRSSVTRARRLRVRSGPVVTAVRLGCAESVLFAIGSVGWARSWKSVRVVGELRPVGVGVGCLDSVGVGWYEGSLWVSRRCWKAARRYA